MHNDHKTSVAFIGSYVPRKCGIATYTNDIAKAYAYHVLGEPLDGSAPVKIIAVNDRDNEYKYGSEVAVEIRQHRRSDYQNAADILNTDRVGVVSLQHEYGLFGGPDGDFILELLSRLNKPVVPTLHTLLAEPSDGQKQVLQRIAKRSSAIVVMAERAKTILTETYGVPADQIKLIHHGVPDVPFGDTEPFKERFDLAGRPVILTFGLLSPGKGVETMLEALAKVVPHHPNLAYVILGETHPSVRRESGESYRITLERRVVELGIQKNVIFHNRYVSDGDLREYLQAADLYVTPYREREQITSGTLAYALACGKAIISTPYWYAQELLAAERGRLVDFDDAEGFALNLRDLLDNPEKRDAMRRRAYDYGREMIWSRAAERYAETFAEAREAFAERVSELVAERKVLMRMSLPEVGLDHFLVMTDGTGILQHAIYSTPDRWHGYTTDDNARALIISAMFFTLFQDDLVLRPLQTYLSFLHYAYNPEKGRFRNFMSYDRRWLENDGSDDCQGRALWALGYLIAHAPNEAIRRLAEDVFRSAAGLVDGLSWPRSWALSILGLHYYLRRFGDDAEARARLVLLADRLDSAFEKHATEDWPWFEDQVTYDNGRLPQALIMAGMDLDRPDMVERGLRVLNWLLDVQRAEEGHLSVIGNKGWLQRDGRRAKYDQQPLEAAALNSACKAAYRASGDARWLVEMRRCFDWYLGRNDGGEIMIDFKTRGCYDGLQENEVNKNQGAESGLAWLHSLLIMYEMQTGDVLEVPHNRNPEQGPPVRASASSQTSR
jgi:glycosyltransferase involved in cell wall biosynthesis